jgi:hypothetical protein
MLALQGHESAVQAVKFTNKASDSEKRASGMGTGVEEQK